MLPDFSDTRGTCVALPVSRVTVPHMPDNASVGSWREVHSNYPKGGGHFGTFLVLLPMGAAPHDDMARDAVEEVHSDLLASVDGVQFDCTSSSSLF